MPEIFSFGSRLRELAVCAVGAIGSFGLLQAQAWAGEWDGGGLPPAIAKPRPSALVPADLPTSGAPCGLLQGLTAYVQTGRSRGVAVETGPLIGRQQGCDAAEPSAQAASPATPALPPAD